MLLLSGNHIAESLPFGIIQIVFLLLVVCVYIQLRSSLFATKSAIFLKNNLKKADNVNLSDTLDNSGDKCDVKDLLRVTQHADYRPYHGMFFDWGAYFPFLAQCVRVKKFPYLQVSDRVLESVCLNSAIKQEVENILRERNVLKNDPEIGMIEKSDLYHELIEKEERRALAILTGMRSQLSDFMLRITSWVLYKLLPRFLSAVVTNTKQINALKATADKADGTPLIFLPLHRSHLDYIIVSFILLNNDIRCPIVVAGDNLKIPIFGFLLRGLGAFFIKRKIDPAMGKKDNLYRTILQSYTQKLLEAGHNLEIFIEGGRTRSGKPCMPKSGFLSVIVNAFMDGAIKDALLVPVSINYERLVDGNFTVEQMGQKKKPETLSSALLAIWKTLKSKYGMMRIDFNRPFSLKDLVNTYKEMAANEGITFNKQVAMSVQSNQSSSSLYGTDVVNENHRNLVESIARQVVYDCVVATSAMSTNAVAFLFLTKFRQGTTEKTLAKELDVLRRKLCGRKDVAFSGESNQIVRYAVDLLGKNLVSRVDQDNKKVVKPNVNLPNVIELAYYANGLAPYFALQSLIVTSLYCLSQREVKPISRKTLKEECLNYYEIFRYEFVLCKPTQNLDQLLDESIDTLCDEEILVLPENNVYNEMEMHSRRIAAFVENNMWDEDERIDVVEVDDEIHFAPNKEEEIEAYLAVLGPYSYAYIVVVNMLIGLIGNMELESDFTKSCISELKRGIEAGIYPYSESVSMESIKNCLKLLERWGIVTVSSTHGVRLLCLDPAYDNLIGINSIKEKFERIIPQCKYQDNTGIEES